jgi:uncharacterized membrane protein YiaA
MARKPHLSEQVPPLASWLFCGLMYLLLLLRWGYSLGRGDQIEVLPYALWLNDTSLFPHDLFLQALVEIVPNERWTIAQLMALWGEQMALGAFLLHMMVSLTLLLGMERLARHFISSPYLAWLAIFLCLIPFYLWNPGANELYYNTFTAANPAKALGIWGLYLGIRKRQVPAALLLALSTLFHPLVGLQLALLQLGSSFLLWLEEGREKKKLFQLLLPFFIYLPTGLLYVGLIQLAYSGAPSPLSREAFFDLIFDFRNAHHYLPSHYPLKSWLMAALCWGMAFWQLRAHRWLKHWLLLLLLGCIIYTIGVEGFRSPELAPAQWFKTTLWLKFLGWVAVMKVVEQQLPNALRAWRLVGEKALLLALSLLMAVGLWGLQLRPPWAVPWDFGQQLQNDPLITVCRQAQLLTPKDAVFIYPLEVTEFAYYGRRSSYVDYKANLKQNAGASVWAERLQQVYGLDFRQPPADIKSAARSHFLALDSLQLRHLAEQGVTHILTYGEHQLDHLPWLAGSGPWQLYEMSGR